MIESLATIFIWEILKNALFGVIGNAVWDRLQPSFQELFKKSWDDLYIDAFSDAFASQRVRLREHSEAAFLDKDQLRKTLSQKLPPEFRQQTTRELPSTKAQKLLTRLIAYKEEIVKLPGHSFSRKDYEKQVSILVNISVDLFKENVKKNGDQLIDEFLKRDDQAEHHLRNLEQCLDEQFGFISKLQRSQERIEFVIREGLGQKSILILYSNPSFQKEIEDSEGLLRSEYTRLNITSVCANARNSTKPLRAVLSDVEACDIAIFVILQNEYDPFMEKAVQTARDRFRRCFFLIADTGLSGTLHPKPAYVSKADYTRSTMDHRRARQLAYQSELRTYNDELSQQLRFIADIYAFFDTVVEFNSVTDIYSQFTTLVNEAQEKNWYGLSDVLIQKQWANYTTTQAIHLQRGVLQGRPLLQSPLLPLWEAFVSTSWLHEVSLAYFKLQEIENALVAQEDITKILQAAPAFAENTFALDWFEIHYAMSERYTSVLHKKFNRKIEELVVDIENKEAEKPELEKLRKQLDAWNEAFKELSSLVHEPKYGRCFLVRGRSGAGKTHFISKLMDQQKLETGAKYRCLHLNELTQLDNNSYQAWAKSFEHLIIEKASLAIHDDEPTYLEWHTLKDLDKFLCASKSAQDSITRLVVILDDFANWVKADTDSFLTNLIRFIKTHTRYRSLTWVMTIDSSDSWYFTNDQEFWREYTSSIIPKEIAVRDWIDLDAINEIGYDYENSVLQVNKEKYGLLMQILTEQGLDASQILKILTKDPQETSLKLLSTPFIAWIAADWLLEDSENISELPNLRFIDFMERFYEKHYRDVRASNMIKDKDGKVLDIELATFIEFIAYLLAGGEDEYIEEIVLEKIKLEVAKLKSSKNFHKRDVLDKLSRYERIAKIEVITILFDALRKNGFVRVTENRIYTLDFIPFWEYKAARQLKSRMIAESIDNLSDYLDQCFGSSGRISDYLGIFEFLILLFDQEIWQAASNINPFDARTRVSGLRDLTAIAFSTLVNLRSTIWVALSKASGLLQGMFINWFDQQGLNIEFETEKDFLDYLYFFRYATNVEPETSEVGVSWDLRIKLISEHFTCLKQWSFSAGYFFKFILNALPYSTTGEKIALSIAYLHGIENYFEPYDLISEMAEIPYVDRSYPRSYWTRVGGWAFDAVQQHLPSSKDRGQQLNRWMLTMVAMAIQKQAGEQGEIRGRDRIWASVLEHYYEDLVFHNRIGSLSLLDDYQWLPWQREPSESEKQIFAALEEYCTVWLGRLWRKQLSLQEAYLASLEELASSDNELKHRTVLLTIFYTVASVRKHREAVDNRLWKLFCRIWDKDKSKIIEKTKQLGFLSRFYENQQGLHII